MRWHLLSSFNQRQEVSVGRVDRLVVKHQRKKKQVKCNHILFIVVLLLGRKNAEVGLSIHLSIILSNTLVWSKIFENYKPN